MMAHCEVVQCILLMLIRLLSQKPPHTLKKDKVSCCTKMANLDFVFFFIFIYFLFQLLSIAANQIVSFSLSSCQVSLILLVIVRLLFCSHFTAVVHCHNGHVYL